MPNQTNSTAPETRSASRPTNRRARRSRRGKHPSPAAAESAAEASPPPGPRRRVAGPAESVGLVGWNRLEPVLLAALATADPILLIGPHGTAKSMVLERLARALRLEHRFYNASIISYDDLIGIPMPNEDRSALHYLPTPSSIWGAEVVFIDELNRTRIDLQNKLFPIIHERRVQGIDLPQLRYRWAAMNPPAEDGDEDATGGSFGQYHGCEPLDPALADRFAFLLDVPVWSDLTEDDQGRLLDRRIDALPATTTLPGMVEAARARFDEWSARPHEDVTEYLMCLEPLLRAQGIRLSARRLVLMQRSAMGIRAALEVLGWDMADDWILSLGLTLRYCLPDRSSRHLANDALKAVHEQALNLARHPRGSTWRRLAAIDDPAERLRSAVLHQDDLTPSELGVLVTDALSSQEGTARRVALALVLETALQAALPLAPCAIETLAECLEPVLKQSHVAPANNHFELGIRKRIEELLPSPDTNTKGRVLRRLLLGLPYECYEKIEPDDLTIHFDRLWRDYRLTLDGGFAGDPDDQPDRAAA